MEAPGCRTAPVAPGSGNPGDSELRPDAPNMPVVTFQQSRYSFPHALMGRMVWVRRTETEVVIVHVGVYMPG